MNDTTFDLIYLLSCAVNGTVPEKSRIESMDTAAVLDTAGRHMLGATAALALESAGIRNEHTAGMIASAMRRTVLFDAAWKEIQAKLTEEGIWHMPLKGAVLKDFYPETCLREFADYDILFDASRSPDVKRIMEELGYSTMKFDRGADDIYCRKPILNFEMHRSLFDPLIDERLYNYYEENADRLLRKNGLMRQFSPDDFYIYFIAHEYKHYMYSGTGLRSLLDTCICLRCMDLDPAYIAAETDRLGIREFEEKNRSLALHLFGEGDLTDPDREMLSYITSSGAFGTKTHQVENKMKKTGYGRNRYMMDRFFVPVRKKNPRYERFAKVYPFFYKYRILLPFLPFYRIMRSIVSGRFMKEAKAIKEAGE